MKSPWRIFLGHGRLLICLARADGWIRINGRLFEYWHRQRSFLPPFIRERRVRILRIGPYLFNTRTRKRG